MCEREIDSPKSEINLFGFREDVRKLLIGNQVWML
jgi:hypothetical protein